MSNTFLQTCAKLVGGLVDMQTTIALMSLELYIGNPMAVRVLLKIVFFVEKIVAIALWVAFMATRTYCDRCTNDCDGKSYRIKLFYASTSPVYYLRSDLCESCRDLVMSFVNDPDGGKWIQSLGLVKQETYQPVRKFKESRA